METSPGFTPVEKPGFTRQIGAMLFLPGKRACFASFQAVTGLEAE
jgi:hypothetical protein